MNKQLLIQQLALEPHLEGGYFRRTYEASHAGVIDQTRERLFMSSIFYLLTDDSPVGYFHRNRSDIVHYWQAGSSLTYYLINDRGELSSTVLGPDLNAGQQLQLVVPGQTWKATVLDEGEFGLLSEAVTPGFDYDDMELATVSRLINAFPDLWEQQQALLLPLCKPE